MAAPQAVLAVIRASGQTFRQATLDARSCFAGGVARPKLGRPRLTACAAAALAHRSAIDRVTFAVHATVLASGYKLVKVGDSAQLEGKPTKAWRRRRLRAGSRITMSAAQ
jgi:hypothetical protein